MSPTLNFILLCIFCVAVCNGYFRGPSKGSFAAAQSYCQSQGATLATIKTWKEWRIAKNVCGGNNICWIGLRDDLNGNDDMIWSWTDGSTISNSYGFNKDATATKGKGPWNKGEPNEWRGRDQDCVRMLKNGKYDDTQCGSRNNYPLCNGMSICMITLFFIQITNQPQLKNQTFFLFTN